MTLQVQSAKTDKLDVEVRKKIENMDVSFGRFDEIETQLKERVRGLDEQLASFEGKLEKSLAKIQSVENEVGRVDRITTALAIATAPGEEADQTRIEAARRGPPPSELGLGVLDALGILQVPTPLGETSTKFGRRTYLLTFSAVVDDTVPSEKARDLLDTIEKVTYTLSESWFNPNVFERTNRSDSFQFSVTVWGRTPVEAKVEFAQGAAPLCWSGTMNLEEEFKFQRAACPS